MSSPATSVSSESDDPPVVILHCTRCERVLTRRGVEVELVASPSTQLYSTDIPTDAVEERTPIVFDTCTCTAAAVHCRGCDGEVGYHVTVPCAECSSGGHNDMYWLFRSKSAKPVLRGMAWSELPYNGEDANDDGGGADDDEAAAGAHDRADDTAADAEACCICACAQMWRPTEVVGCGHRFCFGCISREVDARARCPLCRRPALREMLVSVSDPPDSAARVRAESVARDSDLLRESIAAREAAAAAAGAAAVAALADEAEARAEEDRRQAERARHREQRERE